MSINILTHIPYIISVIANAIASIMIITYNSSSKTYCATTYSDIRMTFASFDCQGTDLQACIADHRCYNPEDTFGHGYCMDDCQCCQQKIINDTSIASIIFLCLTGILLICLIYSIKLQSQPQNMKKPLHICMNGLLVITNIVYFIISVVVMINMDIKSIAIWAIFLIINLLSLIYFLRWFVKDKKDQEVVTAKQSNTNLNNNNYAEVPIQPNAPPPDYNDLLPEYNNINQPSSIQEIRIWFKQTVDLPTDDIDYNHKYCEMLIENGFDTWKAIKYITNYNLIDIGISKLGHRKQILLAIQELSTSNEGQKETNI